MTAAIIAITLGVAGGFVAALAGVGGGILFVPA
ncbi:MAG: sulfite exporter TauE/SafE family protein, partial [Actinobacteria bacterium]|nr:sulfite exporter TauE/SafE family protein [Actinomycetota bacterium]